MIDVEGVFVDDRFNTRFWASGEVLDAIDALDGKWPQRFERKLEYFAEAGFQEHEGRGKPIVHEGGHIYRIGLKRSLFRILGFYNGKKKAEFIAIDAYMKRKQELNASDRKRIKAVRDVREERRWRKV